MNIPNILVIILNWRQPEVTIECVRAVQAMNIPAADILLIDNASGDESEVQLRMALPDISLSVMPHNLGFAAGVNHGLRQAMKMRYQYALLLNNDAFPAKDMLAQLVAAAAPDIALLSPKIFYEAEVKRIWFAGGRQHPSLLEMRDTGQGEQDGPAWQQSHDVDYLVGTGLLVNIMAVQETGLLDERFFMYYEDLDWSIRLRQAGYRLRLVANAHLYHRVALSTGGSDSPLHRYYLARSSVLFFLRHAELGQPWAIFIYRSFSAIKMVARLLLTGQPATARAYVKGLWDGWQMSREVV
jgi:GT2 family glycosyltransferase